MFNLYLLPTRRCTTLKTNNHLKFDNSNKEYKYYTIYIYFNTIMFYLPL